MAEPGADSVETPAAAREVPASARADGMGGRRNSIATTADDGEEWGDGEEGGEEAGAGLDERSRQIKARLKAYAEARLPPAWMIVRHESGELCWLHLPTRVVSRVRPYAYAPTETADTHEPPAVYQRVLEATQPRRGRKRRQRSPERSDNPADGKQPAGGGFGGFMRNVPGAFASVPKAEVISVEGDRVRVRHVGVPQFDLDVSEKSPVTILNEMCPKLLRVFPEIVTTTSEDPHNPYTTTIICDDIIVARGAFSNKKVSRQVYRHLMRVADELPADDAVLTPLPWRARWPRVRRST